MTTTATDTTRCEHCKRPMRQQGDPRWPGTVRHYARGLCSTCYEKARFGRKRPRSGAPVPQLGRLPLRKVDTSWHESGACRNLTDEEKEFFYHPDGERSTTKERRALKAKTICAACPVWQTCRDDARARRETYGTWGMESETERELWLAAHDAADASERGAA